MAYKPHDFQQILPADISVRGADGIHCNYFAVFQAISFVISKDMKQFVFRHAS